VGFKYDPDGDNLANGARGFVCLEWTDEAGQTQTRYYDGAGNRGDGSGETLAGDFMAHARGAIAPVWQVQTTLAHYLQSGEIDLPKQSSSLPHALERFIAYQQRIDAVRSKVVSAAIYPAILISVGTLVSLFLMMYVVPRFAEVYQGAGRQMPWLSQQMLALSSLLTDHLGVLSALALAAVLMAAASAPKFKAAGGWMGLVSRLPGVGERVRVYELSRLYMTLGLLLEGGISLVAAMETVDSVVSPAVAQRLRLASAQVQTGAPVSLAFSAQNLTTPISLRMLAVGERSGDLGGMLRQSAAFYDGEITRWIDRFMRSFEPLLMTAIGLVVGVIVVLLYMPIFDLAGSF
jgi:general secretion pathway protein F